MIDDFDIIFSKTLLKTNKINFKKQIFFGILIPTIFIIFYMINDKYTKVAFLSFVILTSFASFIEENEIFLVYRDFKIFDIELDSFRFYKAYLIQRFFRDDFIMQIMSVTLIFSMFIYTRNFKDLLWFLILIIFYIFTMPINHILGNKYSNMLFPKIILDTVIVCFLVIGVIFDIRIANLAINRSQEFYALILFFIAIIVYSFTLFILSKKNIKAISKIDFGNYYKGLAWLKKIDIHIYKDYIINFQNFIISIITVIVFYFIMKESFDINGTFMTIIFLIAPASFFLGKTNKRYNLTNHDYIFYTDKFYKEDRIYIRRKKLKIILTEIIIKLFISLIILIISKELISISMIIEIGIVAFIVALIHYIIVIRDNKLNGIAMTSVKYTVIFLPMLNNFISINNIAYWSYMIFVMILTLLQTVRVTLKEDNYYEEIYYRNI